MMQARGICLLLTLFGAFRAQSAVMNVELGVADSFAVLAASAVTNTGATAVHGNLGISPGTAVTGFPPGLVIGGTIHIADSMALQAQRDLTAAFGSAGGQPCGTSLTGQNLGGLTLTPGVYCFTTAAQLTGTLTLNSQGDPNAVFIFQIGSTLTTASSSSVVFANGGHGDNVFWQVGSSATLGTTTVFAGNILALTSITLNTGASITCGRALARNGAVTMDTNDISMAAAVCDTAAVPGPGGGGTVPEPGGGGTVPGPGGGGTVPEPGGGGTVPGPGGGGTVPEPGGGGIPSEPGGGTLPGPGILESGATVPEPGSAMLFALGLGFSLLVGRRRFVQRRD